MSRYFILAIATGLLLLIGLLCLLLAFFHTVHASAIEAAGPFAAQVALHWPSEGRRQRRKWTYKPQWKRTVWCAGQRFAMCDAPCNFRRAGRDQAADWIAGAPAFSYSNGKYAGAQKEAERAGRSVGTGSYVVP